MVNPKGGASFIDECIDPNSVNELVDDGLGIVIRKMLDLTSSEGPLIITTPVLILAYIVYKKPFHQATILGVSFYTDHIFDLAIKTGTGVTGGLIALYLQLGLVTLTGAIFAVGIAANVAAGNFKCENFVSTLPIDRQAIERPISYLDVNSEVIPPKIYIKGSKENQLYIFSAPGRQVCYSELEVEKAPLNPFKTRTEKPPVLKRKCYTERDYVPLELRTKTLSDLKKDDISKDRAKAAPYIKRYEARRERIRNERNKK